LYDHVSTRPERVFSTGTARLRRRPQGNARQPSAVLGFR
jgi:hypothetical protein